MRSFFQPDVQEELRRRLQKLDATARGEWGKMSAGQMLAHCTAAMKVPLGELRLKRTPLALIGWMFKGILASDKPFGRNSPTADEFRIQDDRDYETEKKRFTEAFEKLAQGPSAITCHKHAFFGKMSDDDWGNLMFKHLDHHFRQFGI